MGEEVHSLCQFLERVLRGARRGFGAVMTVLQVATWGPLRATHPLPGRVLAGGGPALRRCSREDSGHV